MKAAIVTAPAHDPVAGEFDEPVPADGRSIVELVGAGIHNIVRMRASGDHYSSTGSWPLVPGIDAVARTADGTLVYTGMAPAPWGTMAERISVPDDFCIALPDGVDPLAVAAGCNPGLASWIPLSTRRTALAATGRTLGTVLILGATGMSGGLAVDNARALGAERVVAVGRNADVLDRLAGEHGDAIATVALTDTDDDSDAIRNALDGRAPSIVVDFLWGPVAERTFVAVAPLAEATEVSHVEVGTMAGADARVPGALLRSRRYTLSGSGLGSVDHEVLMDGLAGFIEQVAAGTVRIPYTVHPLSRIGEAWADRGPERVVVVPD
ncbi:zinc-binding alcohol dehydrogenase family protein [Gordonia sp. FQ]|uniref:zinc-binding alcohol dehydrogenase family protein n=1 Tax=Gordonia sp. FQ TaxID=3446634 RepID=UPI003F83B812